MEECEECVEGNPYPSLDDALSLLEPYMFLGVVRSWLKATMPREASRASVYDDCD